jgi:hypothetical protein
MLLIEPVRERRDTYFCSTRRYPTRVRPQRAELCDAAPQTLEHPIIERVAGSEDQRRAMAVKHLEIREILGTKTMREITPEYGLLLLSLGFGLWHSFLLFLD